jgi:hypothetical protein
MLIAEALTKGAEAKERESREDTLGGFSRVGSPGGALRNERSSQYVITRRLTLPPLAGGSSSG